MHPRADPVQLLHDETPPGRCLQGHLELRPSKRAKNLRTLSRCAGATRERETSPVTVSTHSAVICARCWSSPITIAIWGLLKLHGLNTYADYPRLS